VIDDAVSNEEHVMPNPEDKNQTTGPAGDNRTDDDQKDRNLSDEEYRAKVSRALDLGMDDDDPHNWMGEDDGEPSDADRDKRTDDDGKTDKTKKGEEELLFKGLYDNFSQKVRAKAPQLYDEVAAELKEERKAKGKDTPEPSTREKESEPKTTEGRRLVRDMTEEELVSVIRKTTVSANTEHESRQAVKDEKRHVQNVLTEYAAKVGLTADEAKEAVEHVKRFGIPVNNPGGPSAWGDAMIDRITLMAAAKGRSVEGLRDKSEEQTRRINETQQPDKSGAEPKTQTRAMKRLERMQAARPGGSRSLLDSSSKEQ
jgi:hypothetical protein